MTPAITSAVARGGGYVPQDLIVLSIENGPLHPELKLTHIYLIPYLWAWGPDKYCEDASDSGQPWIERSPSHRRESSSPWLASNVWMARQCIQGQLSQHTLSRVESRDFSISWYIWEKRTHVSKKQKRSSIFSYFSTHSTTWSRVNALQCFPFSSGEPFSGICQFHRPCHILVWVWNSYQLYEKFRSETDLLISSKLSTYQSYLNLRHEISSSSDGCGQREQSSP